MATATASASASALATLSVPAAAIVGPARSSRRRTGVKYINGLNSFGGLKAHNSVAALGLPVCTEQSFAKIVSSLKKQTSSKGKSGGDLSSTCNAVAEIFRIAATIPGLVLVGVAVGFVLLRFEATVEEAE